MRRCERRGVTAFGRDQKRPRGSGLLAFAKKKRAADNYGPPLTPAQAAALRFLVLLYPLPYKPRPSPDERTLVEYPFLDLPISGGEPGSSNERSDAWVA